MRSIWGIAGFIIIQTLYAFIFRLAECNPVS